MRTPPPPPFQYTEAELHSACSCSQARATLESVFSWDRCFSDGASRNLVHRNCDSAGDSCCCSTTWWALPNRKHLHMYLYTMVCVSANSIQSEAACYPKFVFLLHVLHHVVLMFLIHHENDRSNVSCWLLRASWWLWSTIRAIAVIIVG